MAGALEAPAAEQGPAATAAPLSGTAPLIVQLRPEDGQTFGEYALVLAAVLLVAAAAFTNFGIALANAATGAFTAVVAML